MLRYLNILSYPMWVKTLLLAVFISAGVYIFNHNYILPALDHGLSALAAKEGLSESGETIRQIQESLTQIIIRGTLYLSALIIVSSMVAGVIFSLSFRTIRKVAEKLKDGDFDLHFRSGVGGGAELSILSSMKGMVERVGSVMDTIIPLSLNINDIISNLKVAATQTASNSDLQTKRSEELAASAEEMSLTINEIARNASNVTETSSHAMSEAEQSRKLSQEAAIAIDHMKSSTDDLSGIISVLSNQMNEIGKVVEMIKSIADQTNLLALNAAIEAARAGGSGSRFAVVSDEVRKLAESTIQATEDISKIVGDIRTETERSDQTMKSAQNDVNVSTQKIQAVAESIQSMYGAFQSVQDQITQIASSVEEQSVTAKNVAHSVEESLDAAKEISQQAFGVKDNVTQLVEVADKLRQSTVGLKTKGTRNMIIDLAKTDHKIFIERVEEAAAGIRNMKEHDITDHFNCRFGKWYYSDGTNIAGELKTFKDIENPHEKIHSMSREVVRLHNEGKIDEANKLYRELDDVSHNMQHMLDALKTDYLQILQKKFKD